MEKKQSTLILIAAIAVVLSVCASVLGIISVKKAGGLEDRVAMLENRVAYLEAQGSFAAVPPNAAPETGVPNTDSDRCSLTLGDWEWNDNTLVLHSGFALVQVSESQLSEAVLELCADGKALEGSLLNMVPGEATDTMEADLAAVSFQLAESELVGTIDLRLTAKLADGTTLTASVGGWSYEGGSLMLITG